MMYFIILLVIGYTIGFGIFAYYIIEEELALYVLDWLEKVTNVQIDRHDYSHIKESK